MPVSLALTALAALSSVACGAAPPIDVGTEHVAPKPIDDSALDTTTTDESDVEVKAASGDGGVQGTLVVDPGAPQSCLAAFTPCGGLLAGTWEVQDTCNSETSSRKALQIWGKTFMGLDPTACYDAVQSVTSSWQGTLVFDQGVATDNRQRSDVIEMDLSPSCLSATFGTTVYPKQMPAVCNWLTDDTTSCSLVAGVCRCTSRRVHPEGARGVYGVLGKRVAIGDPVDFYDYCVQQDPNNPDNPILYWRDPSSARHLVLSRTAQSSSPYDPEYPR